MSDVKPTVTVPLLKRNGNLMQLTLKKLCNHVSSYAASMVNVHYQLALTYEPVHLSSYVAEQGARFLRTQSQVSLRCRPQPAAQKLHITPDQHQRPTRSVFCLPASSEQTRKWHVTLTEAYFLHTRPPHQTPSSFGSPASCEQIWGRSL